MDQRKRGRVTVQSQPTRETRRLERLVSLPFLIVGAAFVIIGVTTVIPNAGAFGVLWTLIAACFVVIGVVNLVRKNGPAHRVAYDVQPEDGEVIEKIFSDQPAGAPSDPAARLTQLQSLLDAGLVTREEYDAKRAEILREL